ncbi:hypothetical protein [Sorangium sp. So ce131]|uniref:hypothetical protein n=1 Tax=Sorangium sp. So ce131 TaxID=3133282 RepID=UPI003F5DAE7E
MTQSEDKNEGAVLELLEAAVAAARFASEIFQSQLARENPALAQAGVNALDAATRAIDVAKGKLEPQYAAFDRIEAKLYGKGS